MLFGYFIRIFVNTAGLVEKDMVIAMIIVLFQKDLQNTQNYVDTFMNREKTA